MLLEDGGGVGLAKGISDWLELHRKFGKDSKGGRQAGGRREMKELLALFFVVF